MQCFNDIYITSDDIKVLDFNEDWKIVQETAHGELKTICSKEECANMRLNFVESAKEENNIVLAGANEKIILLKEKVKLDMLKAKIAGIKHRLNHQSIELTGEFMELIYIIVPFYLLNC